MASSYTASRMTTEFSDEQDVALSKIFDAQIIGKLRVSSRSGKRSDDAAFDLLAALRVTEKIRVRGDHFLNGSGASIDHSFVSLVPEPSTALMLIAGLAGLATAGRRRSRAGPEP